MLNIRDIKIDVASLGAKKLFTGVQPAYEYKDGKRTGAITGYCYEVALVSKKAADTSKENRDYVRKKGTWAETAKAETSVAGTFAEFGAIPSEQDSISWAPYV